MSDATAAKFRPALNLSRNQKQLFSTFSGLFVLCVIFSFLSEYFLTWNNLLTVATQTAVIAVIAVVMYFDIGGIGSMYKSALGMQ